MKQHPVSSTQRLIIGLCLVCTGKYGIFLQPLIDSLDKFFFNHDSLEYIAIYLFSDKHYPISYSHKISVLNIEIEHKPFPYPTLYRYKYFTEAAHLIHSDYLFYLDVDMLMVDDVSVEILPNSKDDCGLIGTLHPGYYNGGGSWGANPESKSYTPVERHIKYYAGGFQGGERKAYLAACKEMADNIQDDENRGVMAEWHDETHWNCYLSARNPKILTPAYCMVEQQHLREGWGIDKFSPKIIALAKDHKKIRE